MLCAVRLDVLSFYTALAALIASHGGFPDPASASAEPPSLRRPGPGPRALRLSRRDAAEKLRFLIEPSRGLVIQLEHAGFGGLAAAAVLNDSCFGLLCAVLGIPGNPFVEDERVSNHFITSHYTILSKLYENATGNSDLLSNCVKHMEVSIFLPLLAYSSFVHATFTGLQQGSQQ